MRPRLLVLAGHDPTGGAGLQADTEVASALGAALCTLPSALTVQSRADCLRLEPVSADLLQQAADSLLSDFSFQAVKFGLLPTAEVVEFAARLAQALPDIPIVTDPVLAAGGGAPMALSPEIIVERLVPHTGILTPNLAELRALTGQERPEQAAEHLHRAGCPWVLVTAADSDSGREIRHRLFGPDGITEYPVSRLPGRYRGSGCTLATAIAALLARQGADNMPAVVERSLEYCMATLKQAEKWAPDLYCPVRGGCS